MQVPVCTFSYFILIKQIPDLRLPYFVFYTYIFYVIFGILNQQRIAFIGFFLFLKILTIPYTP